ncbi:MAG: TonB-dependent receptor [Bacteroidota bacterium]|nr:TonB-dependent receptor [Bacteroidota bacterium]
MILLLVPPAQAQTTGKLAGLVTDAATGESMPGVNVVIDGTTQGATTDVDGRYVVIGVRPGTYTLVASFVGFTTQRVEGVRVNVDLTTEVNFELREEVIEGEEVVVVAEAVRVRKDLTSSEARVTAETIERLPVQELGQILGIQAGVTERGGYHIRGGRSSEVVFMVDGVPVTDSYDGSVALQLENEGIEELQVISGTFNAEYGNAMSGVINVVTKEGRNDRMGGSAEVYTGSYVVPGEGGTELLRGTRQEEFTQGFPYDQANVYSYLPINGSHYRNLNASIEGPVIRNRAIFFANARYFTNDGWLYGANLYHVDGTGGDSTLVPMNTWQKLSWQGNLRVQLTDHIFVNLIGLGSSSEANDLGGRYRHYRWNPGGVPKVFDNGLDLKVKFTHLVSSRTFYTLNVATFNKFVERHRFASLHDPAYNDFTISPPDSVEVAPGNWEDVESGGNHFARGGMDLGRFNRNTRSWFVKGDFTSQVTRHHLMKAGFEGRLDRLSFEDYSIVPAIADNGQVIEPFVPAAPAEQSFSYRRFDDVEPITFSAYLQDKIEYESFIVNAGLRMDYFDSRARVPADPDDPNIYNPFKKINLFRDTNGDGIITDDEERSDNQLTQQDREAYWWTDTSGKLQFSPRLGVAYPVTEEGVIHFSWGHFLQIPTLNRLFNNFGYKIPRQSGRYGPFGNPDLDAQRTVMYEIGFKQAVNSVVVDVTAYNRDVRSWVSTSRLIETELPGVTYVVYANRDYANTRGVTLSLSRPYAQGYGFEVNYTYQVVDGSNSDPDEEFFAAGNQEEPRLALLPLAWDQRHKVAGSLFVGGHLWGASALGVWASGFPYTPSFEEAALYGPDVEPEFPTNARRQPATFQVDLDAFREFEVGRLRPRVFVHVYNVLDRRNALAVYGDTGSPGVTFSAPIYSADAGYFTRPDFYSEPRRVHVGVRLQF